MRILVLSDLWLPFPGGAERYVANLTDALVERGHSVHILTSYAKAKSELPITITDIGVYERHAEGAKTILEFVEEYEPELVVTHHFFAGEFKNELSQLSMPFVELIHNRQRHPSAALAIFNSRYTANHCGARESDIVMLPPASPNIRVDKQLIFPPASYIGHIKPLGGKGIAMTYQLAQIMTDRKFLILRGEWQDGEDIRNIPNVEYMQPCDDIRDFYSRCRIVLMPSLSEDAGTVPQECALNGIPCVSSNVMGLAETNLGGIQLPPDDPYPWIHEICKLDHPVYYKEIAAREKAYIDSLDWGAKYDEIDKRVRELCAK